MEVRICKSVFESAYIHECILCGDFTQTDLFEITVDYCKCGISVLGFTESDETAACFEVNSEGSLDRTVLLLGDIERVDTL